MCQRRAVRVQTSRRCRHLGRFSPASSHASQYRHRYFLILQLHRTARRLIQRTRFYLQPNACGALFLEVGDASTAWSSYSKLDSNMRENFKSMFIEPFFELERDSIAAKLRHWQHWRKWAVAHSIDCFAPEPVHTALFLRQARARGPTAAVGVWHFALD